MADPIAVLRAKIAEAKLFARHNSNSLWCGEQDQLADQIEAMESELAELIDRQCGQEHPLDYCTIKSSTGETLFCSKHYATLFEEK